MTHNISLLIPESMVDCGPDAAVVPLMVQDAIPTTPIGGSIAAFTVMNITLLIRTIIIKK